MACANIYLLDVTTWACQAIDAKVAMGGFYKIRFVENVVLKDEERERIDTNAREREALREQQRHRRRENRALLGKNLFV